MPGSVRVVVCVLAAVGVLGGFDAGARISAQTRGTDVIRVGLLLSQDLVTIGSDSVVDLVDLETGGRHTLEGGRAVFRAGARAIDTATATYGGPVRLTPRAGWLQVNGRPYRGIVEIRRTASGRLTVINELDLEEYLYGVVRSEMDPRWPPEALRAQAVAARSLAVYSAGRFAAEGYDVRATTDSQVYGGVLAEDPRTTAAVDATRGQVILYNGRPAFAAFHADSGGATESSEFVWGGVIPHLRGVADPYAQDTPHHQWTLRLEFGAIEAALQRAGRPVTGVQRVEVVATSPSGRAMTLRLTTATGAMDVRGTEFRSAIGVATVRSTLLSVRPLVGEAAVELHGRGSGHGVGMSQWGARGQALAGRDYTEILRYYYTGITIGPRP